MEGRSVYPCHRHAVDVARARGRVTSAALVLLLVLNGCDAVGETAEAKRFDAERAFADLVDQVAIGPRPAGSPGAKQTRELIRTRLRQAGWPSEEQAFEARHPDGQTVALQNVIAKRRSHSGTRDRILLGAHYDTKKLLTGERFVGANDAASGVALLLELARQLGPEPGPLEIWLAFFDGEEAFGRDIVGPDGLYGSRALAERLQTEGEIDRTKCVIVFDMIADRDLNLVTDTNSSPLLWKLLVQSAHAIDRDALLDPRARLGVVDDHVPFKRAGVEHVLLLIDFQYGARRTPGPTWHTSADDLPAISARSLGAMGELALDLIGRLERQFATKPSAGTTE